MILEKANGNKYNLPPNKVYMIPLREVEVGNYFVDCTRFYLKLSEGDEFKGCGVLDIEANEICEFMGDCYVEPLRCEVLFSRLPYPNEESEG